MLEIFQNLARNQFEAAFCTLHSCIERCPPDTWNQPVVNLKFCQVSFHTLFFTDLYLADGPSLNSLRQQKFHKHHADFFDDYEEFQDRKQTLLYDRATTVDYLTHCRTKAESVISSETSESLAGPSGFDFRPCSRAELHVYNARHIFHHAAQLSLKLRMQHGIEIPWFSHGWTDP